MDILCTGSACQIYLASKCVFYEGDTLVYTGIDNNNTLTVALQKIDAAIGAIPTGGGTWGSITGTITNQTDLITYLGLNYYPLASNPAGYLTSETDPVFTAWLSGPPNISEFTNDVGYITAAALSGYVPNTRTLTINGTSYDLSLDRSWSVGTVTGVTASSPLFSSGGSTPDITIQQATTLQAGFLSATDWNTFNGKGDVFGPGVAVDSNFAAFDTISGKLIKDSGFSASSFVSAGSAWLLASGGTFTGENTLAMAGFNANFLDGNILIGPTGATITANTRLDIQGLGTTSGTLAIRVRNSAGTLSHYFADNGSTYHTDGSALVSTGFSGGNLSISYNTSGTLKWTNEFNAGSWRMEGAGIGYFRGTGGLYVQSETGTSTYASFISGAVNFPTSQSASSTATQRNGPTVSITASYWTGAASSQRSWIFQTIASTVANLTGRLALSQNITTGSSVEMVSFLTTGYVGIGESAPTARLHVVGVGTTSSTMTQKWLSSSLTLLGQIHDNGAFLLRSAYAGGFSATSVKLLVGGLGNTAGTYAILSLNSSGTNVFSVNDLGGIVTPYHTLSAGSNTPNIISLPMGSAGSGYGLLIQGFNALTQTNAVNYLGVYMTGGHTVSSGTHYYRSIQISPTYNITGGTISVSGIVYAPVLTSMTGVTHYAILTSSGLHGFGTLTPTYQVQVKGTAADQNLFAVQENGGTNLIEAIEAAGVNKIGFFGVAPVARPSAYTITNVTPDRSYDADATTVDELADTLGTLISDLQTLGLVA